MEIYVVYGMYNKDSGLNGTVRMIKAFTQKDKAELFCKSFELGESEFNEIYWEMVDLED